jgi:hypothetical protein
MKVENMEMIKKFNKEEYGKMCAEFLGWKEDFAHELDRYGYVQTIDGYKTPFLNIAGHESNRSMLIHSIAQLKFDSDWNWIMEVCTKLGMEFVTSNKEKLVHEIYDKLRSMATS